MSAGGVIRHRSVGTARPLSRHRAAAAAPGQQPERAVRLAGRPGRGWRRRRRHLHRGVPADDGDLDDLRTTGYRRGVGPVRYDFHSPRVPEQTEVGDALRRSARRPAPGQPDRGLKTRRYPEVERALTRLVAGAGAIRRTLT
ncbi:hypothetical protein [Micromonospora sp. NBC_00617]|uniref:hypothetical protein n=1 Tax=Micromonospora sp. NBC_00617 TaxID=2903587 RepID=UPI0030E057F9